MSSLIHGWNGFYIRLACFVVPMWAGLIRERAPIRAYLKSPLLVPFGMLFIVVVYCVLNSLLAEVGLGNEIFLMLVDCALTVVFAYNCGRVSAELEAGGRTLYRRGAVVSTVAAMLPRRRWRRGRDVESITLAGVPIAAADETKHFKLVGTTGTGKSTAIREMLHAALARGDRAVIADPDGGYLANFFDAARGDVILNPFEADSVKWNLLGEIRSEHDVDQLARSLIPDNGTSDRSWTGYARTFFTAVVQRVMLAGITDDAHIFRLITEAPVKELRLLLAGTAAGPFLEEGNERMFGSIRSVTSSAVSALKYTTRQTGGPFSVRGWIRDGKARKNGGRGGVLFLPYKAGEIAALRSMISAWMRIAIFEALGCGEGDQRLWFVVDELDALGEIDGLKDALARLRKFGGRCVLGFQSISQVSSTYGKGVADTVVENCGTSLILRCSASEQGGTSQFASRLIGQREVVHLSKSTTDHPSQFFASTTTSEQRGIEPAVMASEIERLPDLCGFLKLASVPDWMWVRLKYVAYPVVVRKAAVGSAEGTGTMATGAVAAGEVVSAPVTEKRKRRRSTVVKAGGAPPDESGPQPSV